MEDRTERSSCLRVGTYAVMHKIVLDYSLDKLLGQFFSERDMALLLDLASYSIVEESNVAQHYPDYAYNHPLYSSGMKIYSDASVSDFFKSITKDKSTGFLNEWNAKRNRRERIYVSYDSTNKNCQAGEIELAEFGHAKGKDIEKIFRILLHDRCKSSIRRFERRKNQRVKGNS